MANTYDFLGDQLDYFMKSSWQVYSDASGARQYIGKTGNEKTFAPNTELAEWYDNTTGVQYLYALGVSKFEFTVNFSFMQVLDPNVLAMAWNGDLDTSDSTYDYTFYGSDPNDLGTYEWRFVGQGKSGLSITFVIRKGMLVPNGDWASGTPGEWTNLPISVRAIQDTAITNTKRDLAYFMIQKRSDS